MLFCDVTASNIVEVAIVGFADHGIYGTDILVFRLIERITDDGIYSRGNTQGIGQYDGCFQIAQLFYLGISCQLAKPIAHVDGSRHFFLKDVS